MGTTVILLITLATHPASICPCDSSPVPPPARQETSAISGTVRDSAGGSVQGASVIVRGDGAETRVTTGPDGRFTITGSTARDAVLIVRAAGFAPAEQKLAAGAAHANLDPDLGGRGEAEP